MHKLFKDKIFLISFVYVLSLLLLSIFSDYIAPFDQFSMEVNDILKNPSLKYFFGTDFLGRDVFSRVLQGGKISLSIAVYTSFISVIVGITYGSYAAWKGGWLDSLFMRLIDILQSVPSLVLLILINIFVMELQSFSDSHINSYFSLFVSMSLFSWMATARLVRAQVLSQKQLSYVESAFALGQKNYLILFKHILPNILSAIIVQLSYQIPSNIMFESFLSFLGIGVKPPYSSWGSIVAESYEYLLVQPQLILGPALVLFFTVLSFNLMGDKLRDYLDKKI